MGQITSGLTWQMIFLMVVGVVIVVAGVSNLSEFFHMKKPGVVFDGDVSKSVLKTLNDKKGNRIQHYWELSVRYKKGNRIIPVTIKSTTQYDAGDTIRVVEDGERVLPYEDNYSNARSGILLTLAGIGIVAAPPVNSASPVTASWIFCAVFVLLGLALMNTYKKESVTGMQPIEGTITDLILFQTDKEKRHVMSEKHWYPLITYTTPDGRERSFLSRINSNYKTTFKVGSKVQLYLPKDSTLAVERKPSKAMLAAACAMFAIAAFGAISTMIGM